MKKLLIIIFVLVLFSCEKEYQCTTETDTNYMGDTIHSTLHTEFKGTTKEMHEYEDQGTQDLTDFKQTTTCN